MDQLNNITSGLKSDIILPQKSAGIFLYETLKAKDPEIVQMVDFQTGQNFTYGKILDLSVRLAINLKKINIKPDDVIGVVSQNKWEILIVYLATLYNGATINPLNPEYTIDELSHNFGKSKPKVIFCSEKTFKHIERLQMETDYIEKILVFEETDDDNMTNGFKEMLRQAEDGLNLLEAYKPEEVDLDQTCMILTSSGTTGLPKSVQLTHRTLLDFFIHCKDPQSITFTSHDTCVQFLPMFHIFGMYISVGGLLQSTKNILLNKFHPKNFLKIIEEYKVTKALLIPAVLTFLAKSEAVDSFNLSSIRDIMCGSALLSADIIEEIHKKFGVSVRQMYGMTECGGLATMSTPGCTNFSSVGKPVAHRQIKICPEDDPTTCLNHNQPGEIYIKGPGIFKCYTKNPEETAKTKINGWVRSGDFGYVDSDGFVYIIGRLKEIIKHKGFQVSPAELENLLLRYPGVQEVGVVGKPDQRDGELPTAFVVQKNGADLTTKELLDFVAENISVQKHLTGGVIFVEELPKNATGKLVRKELVKLLS